MAFEDQPFEHRRASLTHHSSQNILGEVLELGSIQGLANANLSMVSRFPITDCLIACSDMPMSEHRLSRCALESTIDVIAARLDPGPMRFVKKNENTQRGQETLVNNGRKGTCVKDSWSHCRVKLPCQKIETNENMNNSLTAHMLPWLTFSLAADHTLWDAHRIKFTSNFCHIGQEN